MVPFLTTVADYLVRQSWQIAAVFVLVAVVCWGLRQKSAHWRYLLWLVVLAKCLVPAPMSVPLAVLPPAREAGLPESRSPSAPVNSHNRFPAAVPIPEPERGVDNPRALAAPSTTRQDDVSAPAGADAAMAVSITDWSWRAWLAVAWLLGVGLFLGWVSMRAWGTHRTLSQTRRPVDGETAHTVAALARRLGMRTVPRVYLVDGTAQPFVWGWFRGSIYLSQLFIDSGTHQQRQAILTHELAHVARWDAAVNLVQILVQGVFFFHPLVWIANRQIRREREKCCDEMVIAGLGTDPRQYGEAIVNVLVAEYQATQSASFLAVAGQLNNIEQRIQTILSPNRRFCRWPSRTALATAVLAAAVALSTTLGLTAREPSGQASLEKPVGEAKPPAALAYTGQVTDKLTGKPIVGASVTVLRRVSSRNTRFPAWRKLGETKHQTDAEGRYAFTIPPEQAAEDRLYIEITATHPDYVRYYGGYSFNMIRKNEKLGERPFFEKLALAPAEKISGTVVTPEGKPVKGVKIKAFSMPGKDDLNRSAWADTTTNEEGFFQLGVHKGGEAVFWILPNDYAPSTHVLHAKRGDLGRFTLEKGLVLKGRVVDADGKPLKNVWVNAEIRGGPAKQEIDMSVFDYLARSALSDDQGEFSMAPLPAGEYNLIMADQARSGGGDVHPLPAVFINEEIALDQDSAARPIEIRAVAHVLIAGQFFDSSGKPISGYAPHLFAHSEGFGNTASFWATSQIDEHGKFTVKSPKGFVAALDIMDNEHHAIKTRATKDGPLNNGRRLNLGVVDQDMTEVAILRYVAPTLLVKVVGEDGTLLRKSPPKIFYHFNGAGEGGQFLRAGSPSGYVHFERQDDGRWRTSQLLPDEEFTVTVEAEGYAPQSENLKLPEGAVKELEVRLKKVDKLPPSTGQSSRREGRPSELPGKPPAEPVATGRLVQEQTPGRAIASRAVDAVTKKPVAGAVVKIVVRQSKDERGRSFYRELETSTTTTGPQGQFTVVVPQEYLTDSDSRREVDLFVTASHASYVTGFGSGNPREIARKGDASAYFRLIELEPAKEIYGQAVDAQGRPLAETPVYKHYSLSSEQPFVTSPNDIHHRISTDREGRFRTKVSTRAAVSLEFRTPDAARNRLAVPLDRTDLGVIRIADGVRVKGRVLDAQGQPVRRVLVTAPLQSQTESQPNFSYFTDNMGRFQTDKMSPGDYLFTVHGFPVDGVFDKDEVGIATTDVPGVYVPLLVKIRDGEPVAELTLRPTQDVVRCVVTLVSTRPRPGAFDKQAEPEKLRKWLAEAFFLAPSIAVHGLAQGNAWEGRKPDGYGLVGINEEWKTEKGLEKAENPCTLYVPKGLADATMEFGKSPHYLQFGMRPQHFQLDEKSPKLFGFGIHLDRIDQDLTGIKLYRYRETTLKIQVKGPEGKALRDVQVQARYVREQAVRDAGAILVSGNVPFLKPEGKDGNVRYSVLPEEEIEVSAAAPGMKTAVARVQLKDGEVRELSMPLTVAP